jgi:tetratricopeptide (TPR) repeat protein
MDTRRFFLNPISAALLVIFLAVSPCLGAQQGPTAAMPGAEGLSVRPVSMLQATELQSEKDPDYWYERGALAATYGADRYAIKYFEKVLALDPNRSEAWFEMGVSYGELRWFDKAVEAIDHAISMRPDSGLYYYGRGRIYLMLGAEGQAMADFDRAAEMGNQDAIEYLQRPQR